jgi:hypothetical protein
VFDGALARDATNREGTLKIKIARTKDKFVVSTDDRDSEEISIERFDRLVDYLRERLVGESVSSQLRREFVDAPKPDAAYVRPDGPEDDMPRKV